MFNNTKTIKRRNVVKRLQGRWWNRQFELLNENSKIQIQELFWQGSQSESLWHGHGLKPVSLLRLRNDLYCVEWGVKLYSLTHSFQFFSLGDPRAIAEKIAIRILRGLLFTAPGSRRNRNHRQ